MTNRPTAARPVRTDVYYDDLASEDSEPSSARIHADAFRRRHDGDHHARDLISQLL